MQKKDLTIYYVLIIAAVFFTVCDLVASGLQWLVVSLIFSSMTMIITFVGKNRTRALQIEKGIDKTIDFIKSNFDKANLILSILDVICCVIALLMGCFVIALISRSVLAIKLIVVINKYKTVSYSIIFFVFFYLFKRRKSKMAENENEVKKEKVSFWKKIGNAFKVAGQWIFANKKSIVGTIFAAISGVVSAIVTNAEVIFSLPALVFLGINWTAVLAGILIFAGVEVGVVGKGFETIKDFFDRVKVKKEEKLEKKNEKVVVKAEKKAAKIEAKKIAKAEALVEQRKKEAEKKAKEDAEKAEIEALADKMMAQENNNNIQY